MTECKLKEKLEIKSKISVRQKTTLVGSCDVYKEVPIMQMGGICEIRRLKQNWNKEVKTDLMKLTS